MRLCYYGAARGRCRGPGKTAAAHEERLCELARTSERRQSSTFSSNVVNCSSRSGPFVSSFIHELLRGFYGASKVRILYGALGDEVNLAPEQFLKRLGEVKVTVRVAG